MKYDNNIDVKGILLLRYFSMQMVTLLDNQLFSLCTAQQRLFAMFDLLTCERFNVINIYKRGFIGCRWQNAWFGLMLAQSNS